MLAGELQPRASGRELQRAGWPDFCSRCLLHATHWDSPLQMALLGKVEACLHAREGKAQATVSHTV